MTSIEPATGGMVVLPPEELETLLAAAAERGACRALERLGLENGAARQDLHDLRSLLEALRLARRTAWQTVVRLVTTGILLALMAGIAIKLKLFGPSP